MELIKSLCSQFADAMERHKYTRLFVYYADETEITDVDVLSFAVSGKELTIEAEEHFGCAIKLTNVKTAYCGTEPDGVVELELNLVDGTEFVIDTYA